MERDLNMPDTIIEVRNLSTTFKQRKSTVHAVNGISFSLKKGEMLGVVGESGCGKSVSMLSIVNLLPPAAKIMPGSQVVFDGEDLMGFRENEMQRIRGKKIGMIFQDPMTSLNPVMKIGKQMTEALRYHYKMSKNEAVEKCGKLLELVGMSNPHERLNEYPHQLSGGMRQRIMIAMALACDPEILIADEPTTALDVTIQAQIVELILDIRKKLNTTIILITHDLGLIAGMVDRVIVMYAGYIVEEAAVTDLYADPRHPYTRALLKCIPKMTGKEEARLASIEGSPPDLRDKPQFCPFAPRCSYTVKKCWNKNPCLQPCVNSDSAEAHNVACWIDTKGGEKYESQSE
jgi:oligopeptide/dipeptide ABC transporter ATP-binding protein